MMTYYDYKVVPAPRRAKKVKGVSGVQDLFALTLTETINEIARQGWEYYSSESLSTVTPGGWFRRAVSEEQTLLVFRKPREHLSPRLAAVPVEEPAAARDGSEAAYRPRSAVERPMPERAQAGSGRREPVARLEPRLDDEAPAMASPLRATPHLGPAEKN